MFAKKRKQWNVSKVYFHIFSKMYGKNRLEIFFNAVKFLEDFIYRRAIDWEIVVGKTFCQRYNSPSVETLPSNDETMTRMEFEECNTSMR